MDWILTLNLENENPWLLQKHFLKSKREDWLRIKVQLNQFLNHNGSTDFNLQNFMFTT